MIRDTLSGHAGAIGVDLSLEERASACRAVAGALRGLAPALKEVCGTDAKLALTQLRRLSYCRLRGN